MHRLFLLQIVVFSVLALAGCSKALTESSAVKVVQTYVNAQNGGTVSTSIGSLTNQLGSELTQSPDQVPVGMQRVLKEGLLQQKANPVVYPNYSGEFAGSHYESLGIGADLWTDKLIIQTGTETPPRVRGSFQSCGRSYIGVVCASGSVEGIVQKQGPTQLALKANANAPSDQWEPGRPRIVQVTLVRGNPRYAFRDILFGS